MGMRAPFLRIAKAAMITTSPPTITPLDKNGRLAELEIQMQPVKTTSSTPKSARTMFNTFDITRFPFYPLGSDRCPTAGEQQPPGSSLSRLPMTKPRL
jgi:hypothetical protein